MKTNILKGKSQKEIIDAFCEKHRIHTYDWKQFVEQLEKVPRQKNLQFIWTIPVFLIGITALFTSFGFFFDDKFPLIYEIAENATPTFFQRFVNIFYALILFITPSIIVAIPIIKWGKTYGWT